jgi:UDP-glucuronate 4-epimerase
MESSKILVTGSAGFIGFHLCNQLLEEGHQVIGLDNLNDYYDVGLKNDRNAILQKNERFSFHHLDVFQREPLFEVFKNVRPEYVVNLAAQAGVRYSLKNPYTYADSNLVGFLNILEACRNFKVKHLVFASSSSVYGANAKTPFSVSDPVEKPVSLYAATKRANELMAYTYSHLYKIPTTGLRFFTVYGPWGRPDMAYFSFTKAITEGKTIKVFNHGKMKRDFTFVEDIVDGVIRVCNHIPNGDAQDPAPFKLYNIGNNSPVELGEFISILENAVGKEAVKEYLPMQPGDVPQTYADISDISADTGFSPKTDLTTGLGKFVEWYKEYYQ